MFTNTNLQRDRALQFQFVLKGLVIRSRVDNLLQDMIRGFNGNVKQSIRGRHLFAAAVVVICGSIATSVSAQDAVGQRGRDR